MTVTLGIILALSSMIGFGFHQVFVKLYIKRVGEYSSLVYTNTSAVLFIILTSLIFNIFSLPSKESLIWIFFAGLVGSLAIYFLFKGLNKYKVSIIGPIASTHPVITIILAFILFREVIRIYQYLAVILIIVAVIMISTSIKELKSKKGFFYGLLTALGWGLYSILVKLVTNTNDFVSASIFLEVAVLGFIILPMISGKIKLEKLNMVEIKQIILTGFAMALGVLGMVGAFKFAPLSIAAPIVSASILVTIVTSWILLKEKLTKHQYFAIALIIIGIVAISI